MNDYVELYKWVEEHPITRPKRNINRDFSDAVPLVQILKHHFPKLVQEHNYSPKNSYAQKLVNWQTLNSRVLKKLNINLTIKKMELLANAEPGAIESVLELIKAKIEKLKLENDSGDDSLLSARSDKKSNSKKFVPVADFEKLEATLREKDEAIETLRAKVEHLENLLSTKEEHINDLTKQVHAMQGDSASNDNTTSKARFFSLF